MSFIKRLNQIQKGDGEFHTFHWYKMQHIYYLRETTQHLERNVRK